MQIEERSYKIWGGEAGLEEEHQNKLARREKKKEKKYAKEIKGEPVLRTVVFQGISYP